MLDKQLQHQLNELANVKRAPLLWREQTRARLLKNIEVSASKPYSFSEQLVYRFQSVRLALAPMHLAPVVVALFVMLAGYSPFTSALAASLPGSPLYPIKRTVEKFELSLRSSSDSQGLFYLTLAGRRLTEAQVVSNSTVQAELLRDYNIDLGFAAASLETGLASKDLAAAYDKATDYLAANLNSLAVSKVNRQVYKAALNLTNKVSSRALALLVSQHGTEHNGVGEDDVALRLSSEIAKMEAKLEDVEVKVKEFPASKPAPRVVLGHEATVVPVAEAQALAKANLSEAKELVARKEFSLALEKVQESEDLTTKSEAAVTEEETTPEETTEEVPVDTQEEVKTEGEVKGESTEGSAPQTDNKTEETAPAAEAGGSGEVVGETNVQ